MSIRRRRRQDFETWLKWREVNVNASEAPALFGVDIFSRTALQLFYEKKGVTTKEETKRMKLGRWLEAATIEAVKDEYPDWTVIRKNHYYDDPVLRIGCTPDAFMISPDGLRHNLQCKFVGEYPFRRHWTNRIEEETEEDEEKDNLSFEPIAPVGVQLQTNIETKMSNCVAGKIAALVLERAKVYIFDVPRHDDSYEAVKEETAIFWDRIRTNSPPPIDRRKDAALIKSLYPQDDGSTIDLSDHPNLAEMLAEEQILAEKISDYRKQAKPYKEKREDIRTLIKSLMGSATRAILPGYSMTWKTQERKASVSRILRIKEV